MLRQRLVCPYEHVKHVSNFKSRGCSWRPCGRIFKFCKFRRKEKEIEPFDVISENRWPNGFFWPNKKKKSFFRICRPILDIFGFTLLNKTDDNQQIAVYYRNKVILLLNFCINIILLPQPGCQEMHHYTIIC